MFVYMVMRNGKGAWIWNSHTEISQHEVVQESCCNVSLLKPGMNSIRSPSYSVQQSDRLFLVKCLADREIKQW